MLRAYVSRRPTMDRRHQGQQDLAHIPVTLVFKRIFVFMVAWQGPLLLTELSFKLNSYFDDALKTCILVSIIREHRLSLCRSVSIYALRGPGFPLMVWLNILPCDNGRRVDFLWLCYFKHDENKGPASLLCTGIYKSSSLPVFPSSRSSRFSVSLLSVDRGRLISTNLLTINYYQLSNPWPEFIVGLPIWEFGYLCIFPVQHNFALSRAVHRMQ